MSNELEVVQEKCTSVFSNSAEFAAGMQIAKMLASSEIVPDAYRNRPSNCLIALDYARQVQTSPLIVMQNLYIVKGRPSWSSSYISGVIRAKYPEVWHEMTGEGDDKGCQVFVKDAHGRLVEGTKITIEMAKAEGWFSKKDKQGKECSKWQTMPDLMLQYRAYSFFGRVNCPEKLLGMLSEYEAREIYEDKAQLPQQPVKNIFAAPQEAQQDEPQEAQQVIEAEVIQEQEEGLFCEECAAKISENVAKFSMGKYGRLLCMPCQKEA